MFWFVRDGRVRGIMITHVDDLLYGFGPDCKAAKESIVRITTMVKLKEDATPFTYCGKYIEQDILFSITITMRDATRALHPVHISKARRAEPEAALTPEEITEMRSGFGSLGWIARQLRADIAVDVSLGQQATSDPRVRHLIAMNRCIENCKKDDSVCLKFHHHAVALPRMP